MSLNFFNILVGNSHPIFYDCEFEVLDHGTKILPISIALVELNEFGKKLYLINSDYDWTKSNDWLIQNVKPSIDKIIKNGNVNHLPENFRSNLYLDVCDFYHWKKYLDYYFNFKDNKQIQTWGYYSDFDHVVLSSIYGEMINFPKYLNMWTNDIQQLISMYNINKNNLIKDYDDQHDCLADACWNRDIFNCILNIKGEYSD